MPFASFLPPRRRSPEGVRVRIIRITKRGHGQLIQLTRQANFASIQGKEDIFVQDFLGSCTFFLKMTPLLLFSRLTALSVQIDGGTRVHKDGGGAIRDFPILNVPSHIHVTLKM